MWARNKETCCDYSDPNTQQVHYKFDFRIRTRRIINLHVATGEARILLRQGQGCCCRRFFTYDEITSFFCLHVNVGKSHRCSMKNHTYILHLVWGFFCIIQSSRCHLNADLGLSAVPCTERGVIIQWCDVIFSSVQLLSSGFGCAQISILTIWMHTNTLIMIIMCLGAPRERLEEERIDGKSRSGWKNPDDAENDGRPLNQQAAICGLLLLSVCLLIHL